MQDWSINVIDLKKVLTDALHIGLLSIFFWAIWRDFIAIKISVGASREKKNTALVYGWRDIN